MFELDAPPSQICLRAGFYMEGAKFDHSPPKVDGFTMVYYCGKTVDLRVLNFDPSALGHMVRFFLAAGD